MNIQIVGSVDPSHSFNLRVNLPAYTSLENYAGYD